MLPRKRPWRPPKSCNSTAGPRFSSIAGSPSYLQADLKLIYKLPMTQQIGAWWHTGDCRITLPNNLAKDLLTHIHRATHLGARKTADLLRHAHLKVLNLQPLVDSVASACLSCWLTNSENSPKEPGAHWEMDFTKIKPGKYGYR